MLCLLSDEEFHARYLTLAIASARIAPLAMSNVPTLFDPPAEAHAAPAIGDYIQPNLGHGLRIWWAYYWPTTLITLVLGLLLGRVVTALWENFIVPAKALVPVTRFGPYVINYAVALFIMHYVLGKTFRHFRLGLVPSGSMGPADALKPTFARTLRVWWIFTWRTVLYTGLSVVFVTYPMGMFVGLFNPSPNVARLIFLLLGFATGGALSLFVIYSNILDEDIGDFRVVLLPRQSPVPAHNPLATDAAPLG
jgi:hypothetical protein